MNFVKGVAGLLKRSSGGQVGEGGSWTHAEKHSAPSPRIRFSETNEEAILNSLWQRYENTIDKVEKRKSLQVFLLHFIQAYENWEPENNGELSAELSSSDDIIIGCSCGHPSEVILILVQEIARLTSLVSELNSNASKAKSDTSDPSSSLTSSADGLYVLNSLMIANRSMHNCKVFSYYGGVQKVTALLKAAVVRLKTLTSTLGVDEQLSSSIVEKTKFLQKILCFAVSIVFGFMQLYSSRNKNVEHMDLMRQTSLKHSLLEVSAKNRKDSISEARIHWQQKAIILVMEAGGVNWLVELLRVLRRLNLKEHWTDLSLHYLTLGALKLALFDNPRAQNHFRSIGGLEVLLDGIGPPSSKFSDSSSTILCGDDRNYIFRIFQLQVISMEVLRESVFGNMNNLQFICENGRIHKFANSVCWPAFMLQELQVSFGLAASDSQVVNPHLTKDSSDISSVKIASFFDTSGSDCSNLTEWTRYSIGLSRALCSFLLAPEDIESEHDEASLKSSMSVSLCYWELSIRWTMKVLLTIFPCIKACSNETELPNHIRALANSMQHCFLCTIRKILVSSPSLLEVFREEGIWELIFSEKFFYFGLSLEESDLELEVQTELNYDAFVVSKSSKDKSKCNDVDILQQEGISFLEFAATLSDNTNNLPECSVLIQALEQSARNPDLATLFLRSLQRILQRTPEQSVGSFMSLDAITRVLKVACIQAQEVRKFSIFLHAEEDVAEGRGVTKFQRIKTSEASKSWVKCMQSSMELFTEYLSIAEHVRSLVVYNASCINCLFELFWEESLRKYVIGHIVGFFKLPPLHPNDRTAKLQLCSKYLETFTRAKEREELYPELSIDLLVNMREIILIDPIYYQTLFRDGECFVHIVSLLNGTFGEEIGEQLLLNVLQTLTLLLNGSIDSKAEFRALVGVGYQTLQSLLLDFCKCQPSERLLNALLDMLVDGKFDMNANAVIKNDDVILLFFNVLQKSSISLQYFGLDVFQNLLKDSISNRTSCFRAGVLTFLLDWFAIGENDKLISKIAQLIQVIGGHSISGKDIRRIFALLRNKAIGSKHNKSSLLLTSILFMLKERGPEAFFEFNGNHSGISINTPLQWPCNKGFSFSCWLRVEEFPERGVMGLFSFHSDNGRGCSTMLGKGKLIFESINQKRHCISLSLNLHPRKWYFLCITHSIGRAFSGGSPVRCFVDGDLVSSEKCSYAKAGDALTWCSIGTEYVPTIEGTGQINFEKACAFIGQMGPVYMFSDTLTSEQIKAVYSLGPSYMYSFLGDEILLASDSSLYDGILDVKDGLSSKIIFGFNAQASNGSSLFNVSSLIDSSLDKSSYAARIMDGTQLCSRHLLQEIIYCVGGAAVFFPLLTQFDLSESGNVQHEYILIRTITRDKLAAKIIDLITSVLDENLSNQQQIHRFSGLSILGFLFQSVPPEQLNMETLSALKNLFNVLCTSGISELLLKEAISRIYLNPHIWVYASYEVQRDLYMFLIQYFEKEVTLLPILCGFPRIIDIIRQFYWDKPDSRSATGCKPLLHSITKQVIGERPVQEEVRKIRLLLLSLAEMSLRQTISASDINALIAFFERSQDMVCIEDVLHMVIRTLSQKQVLASFSEQVSLIGGSQLLINLLHRELEPIRLLGLQLLGKLLVGVPSEKKGTKFFSFAVGRSKSISEYLRKGEALTLQPVYYAISERLFAFPLSDHLYATLFDVLLGGASPKQVLQKRNPSENAKNKKDGSAGFSSYFFVPQIIVCIFKYLASCHDVGARTKILGDLLDLLVSDLSNTETLMETAWSSWLATSVKLVILNNIEREGEGQNDTSRIHEIVLIRNLYCIVLSHYIFSVKSGWHRLEETVNFFLLNYEQGGVLYANLLRGILEDLVGGLLEASSDENIYALQPCRDNSLYLLKLADELLIGESGDKILFPEIAISSNTSSNLQHVEHQKCISSAVLEILNPESEDKLLRTQWSYKTISEEGGVIEDDRWVLYDKLWHLISEMNGRGPSKALPKNTTFSGPTFGQRARGLVESLNIPAAEMAAVVVSGGIGTALGTKPGKYFDKAILLRGEKCPRIAFHLLILYLSKAGLERASRCVQQFISLLPFLISFDDDQGRNRLHFLIWSLLAVRSQIAMLDDGARFHVISHLILEIVNYGKSILATSILGRDDSFEVTNNTKEAGFILSLIQRERVLAAATDEAKYIKATKDDRIKQLQELHAKIDECSIAEHNQWKAFEEDMTSTMNMIVSLDDGRKAAYQLAYDEDQQIVADKWLHMFRTLIDERGPWSACPFPNNNVTHWKLDKTEDNWRRRPKLKRNYKFDEKLCYPPKNKSSDQANQQIGECNSSKGGNFPEQMKRFLLKGVRGITEERPVDLTDEPVDLNSVKDPDLNSSSENEVSDYIKDGKDDTDIMHDKKDLQSVSAETESDEVHLSISCVLISPKRKLAGHLFVMQKFLHFTGQFLVEGTGGSSVLNKFSDGNLSDPTKSDQLSGTDKQKQSKGITSSESSYGKGNVFDVLATDDLLKNKPSKVKLHRRWNISKIKSVHWTRYLLQYTAIEIFFNDSAAPVFLNFVTPKDAKNVGTLLVSLRNESLFPKASSKVRSGIISFVDRRVALEMAETFREVWRRREISNFEYLMLLNTLAGRSYNDLTQYPVFPWVLADYSSEKLDFNKSSTFRDLSKPVGALDTKRFEVFEDRYRNFSDLDIPSFYYGSHYSSMGIVLFYLLRMEPFTALHRNLQGGKFDHADRLFQSIEGTYRNCLSNTSDVKELIPEFFYMPEFLVNSNSYHFGVKQDGEAIVDVVLPPWSKGSPEEFIYRNREALESEYVSSNLHQWIDLIFGYKQRGKPAVEAANVFYYLTYEGAVDLESMEDALQRSAIEDQIANFGQTPIQIFRKKHPRRGPPMPIAHPLYFAPSSINLTTVISNVTNSPSAIIFVGLLEANIVIVSHGLFLSVKLWLTTQLQFGGNYTFSGSQEPFFGIGSDVLPTRKIGTSLANDMEYGIQCLVTMQNLNENYLILCGNWENSFQVISVHDGKIVQSIHQHKDLVSCVAVTSDGSILATGSYDTTVMIWHAYKGRSTEKKGRNMNSDLRKDHVISENPFHILCGHDDIITCLFISLELDIAISGSKDGTCVFHTLREGRYVRSIQHPFGCSISKLVASLHGRMVIYADDDLSLHMYSVNGKHIASSESNGRLICMELSGCGNFLICAGDHGQIVQRSMHSLDVLRRFEGIGKVITSLTVTPEECILAGTKDGSLLLYSIDNTQLRKGNLPRNGK
ncbi:hypothetical protein IEQ34_019452 [Dendrobium chrysotoxum]|uniref:BEACH domain-containing protein B n=1 Tax=Dendrobium chrysotoxum TaxID=161865 RepID=A0AAV7G8K6_DENCH|nr:hypothetical protein IEQ34_019452 [Dendrobium chrysotoxum]